MVCMIWKIVWQLLRALDIELSENVATSVPCAYTQYNLKPIPYEQKHQIQGSQK